MKKLILLALPLLLSVACTQEQPIMVQNTEVCELSCKEESLQLKEIAKKIALSDVAISDMQYVYQGISMAVENGIDEVFYVKELLNEDSKIVHTSQLRKEMEFVDVFKLSEVEKFYETSNNSNRLMIYWPFHENWDGVSKPVISFTPENHNQQHNIAYYVENGELKTVDVDLDYIKNNPVWIVCLSPIVYNQLPNFNNPGRLNIGQTLNIVSRKEISSSENKISNNFNLTRSPQNADGLTVSILEIKPSRFISFVGNSITYHFYGNFTYLGENIDDLTYFPLSIIVTASEYNEGVIYENGMELVSGDNMILPQYDFEFCIATTTVGSSINPPLDPILPFSIDIPNEQTIIVNKNYENMLNNFETENSLFSDSISYRTSEIVWRFELLYFSGMS